MAALVAGVQYGLSSHSNFSENKSLIFVKLTDSAQRAIEDFLRNRNKTNQNPTIQFLGNEGQLSFPSTQSSHGSAGFTFSLSGNQDIEGPQGGFECIQQTGSKSLQSLGTLPCKMRIQANDDVYETTRHRMAVCEENNKNKCTRVIKANGPDIGRKVKVKSSGRTIPPPIPNARHRESTSIPTSSSQSSRSQSSSVQPTAPTTMSTTSSSSSSSSSFTSYKPIQNNSNPPPIRNQPEKKFSDIMRRPLRERLIHLLALRPYKRPELYNRITTEGIKERDRSTTATLLKQVAFMRDNTYHLHRHVWNDVQEDWPFYTEQEKAMLKRRKPQNLTPPGSSDGGSSGSGQSPNSTHAGSPPAITAPPPGLMSLKRPGYYQSADGLQTKKPRISHFRKSDTNVTTGSGNSNNGNRDNARTTAGGNVTSGGTVNGQIVAGAPTVGSSSVSVVSGSGHGGGGGVSDNNGWEQRQQQRQQQQQHHHQQQQPQQHQQQQQQQQQQQRDRADYRAERTTNSDVIRGVNCGTTKSCPTPTSDSEDHNSIVSVNNRSNTNSANANASNNSTNSHANNHYGNNHHSNISQSYNNNSTSNNNHGINGNSVNHGIGGSLGTMNFVRASSATTSSKSNSGGSAGAPNGSSIERRDREDRGTARIHERERERERERARDVEREYERDRESREKKLTGGNNAYDEFTNSGASGNSANNDGGIASPEASENYGNSEDSEYPDYLTYYTTISSMEQRRRYKNDFSKDYEEYRTLHTEVGRVAERFTVLEAQWRRELQHGNHERTQAIKNQIMQAYTETRNDPIHKEKKQRFDYLHKKLSHLKQLVHEYDTKNLSGNGVAGGGGGGGNGNGNGETDVGNRGGLRN